MQKEPSRLVSQIVRINASGPFRSKLSAASRVNEMNEDDRFTALD